MNDPLKRPDTESRNHNISESVDKLRIDTKVKRGSGTRDQDVFKVVVKGDDPDDVVDRLDAVLANLTETFDDVRAIQPGAEDDE